MTISAIMEGAKVQLGVLWSEDAPDIDAPLEEWAEWALHEEVFFEATAPKDPTERALKRMADAYKRGGFKKMVRATEIRLKAVKNDAKREGMIHAIQHHLKSEMHSQAEKKVLLDLLRSVVHKHAATVEDVQTERDPGQAFAPPIELKVGMGERFATDRPTVKVSVQSKPPNAPKHYLKVCDMGSFRRNIEYFYRIKGKDWPGSKEKRMKRAIAASYSVLKRSCGLPDDGKKMKPSQIIQNRTRDGVKK